MSTVEDEKKQIETLLNELNFESLKKSHKSVLLSFEQMLDYVDKVRKPVTDQNLKLLLETYWDLAQKYFTQFELSLLKEIRAKGQLQNQVQSIVDQIGEGDEGKKLIRAELVVRKGSVDIEQSELVRKFPSLLQDALDKLRDEWQRLDAIAVASQTAPDLVKVLDRVVGFAAYSIGIQDKRIVVVPGTRFALFFFSYLKNFAILTVPIYSVQAPWDWSILWHELAGYQVQELGNGETIKAIGADLTAIYDIYKGMNNDAEKNDLLLFLTNNVTGGYDYLKELFGNKELDLKDLGSFEYLFERISLDSTWQRKDRFVIYESMKKNGWCVDWIKELFEDAFSVLTFRYRFLKYFEDILGRHDNLDGRHPPKEIRLGVAKEILKLAGFPTPEGFTAIRIEEPDLVLSDDEKEKKQKIVEIAAEQIFNFITLVLAASRHKNEQFANVKEQSYVQQNIPPDYLRNSLTEIEEWISVHILEWFESIGSNVAKGTPRKLSNKEKDFFLSDDLAQFIKRIRKDGDPVPCYEDLLEDKNYRELLALSFYDVDFGTPAASFAFTFRNKPYLISAPNLASAVNIGFVFEFIREGAEKIHVNNRDYWTTSANIDAMKDPSRRWIM